MKKLVEERSITRKFHKKIELHKLGEVITKMTPEEADALIREVFEAGAASGREINLRTVKGEVVASGATVREADSVRERLEILEARVKRLEFLLI